MKTVSESIFSGKTTIIPMADVQHIEKVFDKENNLRGIHVITKHTTWDNESDFWDNPIYLTADAEEFIKAWCFYRHELEIDTLKTMP